MANNIGLVIGGCGLFVALWAGWFIVRGPFFGYPVPPLNHLLVASAVFILGTYIFAWGVDINWKLHRGVERPDIDEHQDHTLDMGFGPR